MRLSVALFPGAFFALLFFDPDFLVGGFLAGCEAGLSCEASMTTMSCRWRRLVRVDVLLGSRTVADGAITTATELILYLAYTFVCGHWKAHAMSPPDVESRCD